MGSKVVVLAVTCQPLSAEVTDDSKWDEIDRNAIANLHLALVDGVLSSIEEKKTAKDIWDHLARLLTDNVLTDYLVFDDVAAAVLEEENRRNNREDMQTSSRQVEALVVTRGRSMKPGSSGSHNHGKSKTRKKASNVASRVTLGKIQWLEMKAERDLQ
ncbi:hypothetical protein Tco_1220701 [Tanacetum coccineum]